MFNLSKLKLGKFVATIVVLSSISAILSTAEQAEAVPAPTILSPGSSVKSNNQCFSLNAQADGNLVLYKQSNGQALWNTATYGRNVKQTIFQTDGNLVIYNTSNQPVWASNTERRGATQLNVQDDGNVVMYNSQNQPIWATNTVASCGNNPQPAPTRPSNSLIHNTTMQPGASITSNNQCFSLNAQADGNLVIYRRSNGQALWNTATYGRNVKQTIFQTDGNLVIYNTSNQPVWTSNTDRRGGTRITLQDDGNFVMYNAQNQALWATNTVTSCNAPPAPQPPNQRASQRKINDFVNQWKGKTGIARYDLGGEFNGQCVTLIARYLQDNYGTSKTGLVIGNGADVARKVGTEFPSFIWDTTDTPIPGSILSFPSIGGGYGHVALVVSSTRNGNTMNLQILDSNGDTRGVKSVVALRNITVDTRSWTAPGYGSILWSNPRD